VNHPESEDDGRSGADAVRRAATFDDIVASWVAEGTVPAWPSETGTTTGAETPTDPAPPKPPRTPSSPDDVAGPATRPITPPVPPPPPAAPPARAPRPPAHEEHFVPPDPPPLPHLGPPAIVGLTLLVLGIILAVTPQVVGLNESAGLPLGLLTLALGLGWLVLRTWPTEEPDDSDDDGAVL
jgi:hypothetical protein